jgi:hypothetical protein
MMIQEQSRTNKREAEAVIESAGRPAKDRRHQNRLEPALENMCTRSLVQSVAASATSVSTAAQGLLLLPTTTYCYYYYCLPTNLPTARHICVDEAQT